MESHPAQSAVEALNESKGDCFEMHGVCWSESNL